MFQINWPSFNPLFSRLDQKLGKPFSVYYIDEEGKSAVKEDSDSTVKEVLLQTLGSDTEFQEREGPTEYLTKEFA